VIEIERKFLVKSEAFKLEAQSREQIVQGFLNTDPERTVRVRINGDFGYLTVKGVSNESGTSRFEWETEISVDDARLLIPLCEDGIIEKTRYMVSFAEHIFEIDEFHGDNAGLVIAEIELNDEDQVFEKPDWLGTEVTGDIKYYNSQLSKKTYKHW
jgi:CYTH domain-containing protein